MTLRTAALTCLIALALAGCGGPAAPGPAEVTCEAAWTPAAPRAGELVRLQLDLRSSGPLPEGARLLLGFPHPYYALRSLRPGDGFPPTPIDPGSVTASTPSEDLPIRSWQADQGHWYLLAGPLDGAEEVTLDVPGIRVPGPAWRGFGPLLLLDEAGDGGYRRVCDGVGVDVEPGEPWTLRAVVPSVSTPGQEISVGLRLEDRFGNPTGQLIGEVEARFEPLAGRALHPSRRRVIEPGAAAGTGRSLVEVPPGEGVYIVEAWWRNPAGPDQVARSNPIRVSPAPATRIAWGDVHGHSALADGWGSPPEHYAWARDVAFLDVASVSEHDWQLDPAEAASLRAATEAANDPGRFVALPAMEINLAGHEVAYFFDGERLNDLAPGAVGGATTVWEETDLGRPGAALAPPIRELLSSYGEDDLLVVTHSSLAPGMGTALPLVQELPAWEVIEIYSVHGSDECRDCPRSAWRAGDPEEATGSVRDALHGGAVLGFIAAGDSHDGRPGLSRWGRFPGGLTAFATDDLTRSGIQAALRDRRTWATTGERLLLDFEVGGHPMGSVLRPDQVGPIRFRVTSAQLIEGIDVIRDGEVFWTGEARGLDVRGEIADPAPPESGYYYLRVRLRRGGMGWTSPIYVRGAAP